MDYPGSRPEGRAVRQRVLEQLDASAPLTIIEGVPGSGKQALIRQRCEQLRQISTGAAADSPAGPHAARRKAPIVLIEFPQRALGDAHALGFAAAAFAEQLGVPASSAMRHHATLDALLRGQVDASQLERALPSFLRDLQGLQLCLVNYEWQASSAIDRLIVASVAAGADVLCSLVDASDVRAAASVSSVATTVITDDQLVFTPQEIGLLAASFGLDPTPELTARVHELTAGHPLASSMLMLRALGIERMVLDGSQVRAVIGGVEREWRQVIDLRTPTSEGASARRHIDADTVNLALLRSAGGMLSYAVIPFMELLATRQGRSQFMSMLRDLVAVPAVDLDALASVLPGALRAVERLRLAGYARIEYVAGTAGIVHWNEGMHMVLRDWLHNLPRAEHQQPGSGFAMRLVSWYGEHGRPQDGAQLLQDLGDVDVLESFVGAHLIDMVWTRRVQGFTPVLALPDAQRAQLPTVTVLAALESYRSIRQDRELARRTLSIFPLLEQRMRTGSVLQRLNSALALSVGAAALDRWESYGSALRCCADAVAEAGLAGQLDSHSAARADLILGVLALIRADVSLARTLLLRALAEGVQHQGRAVAVLCLRVLEGYFGQRLLGGSESAQAVQRAEDLTGGPRDGASWGAIDEFVALAQAWQAVWNGEPGSGLEALRQLIERNGRLLTQPFIAWSYTLLLLLDGQAQAAYGVWEEVERRLGADAPMSGRRLLGMALAGFASGHAAEAVALVERHGDGTGLHAVLARGLVAFSTGRPLDESVLFVDAGPAMVPRAETLLQVLLAGRSIQDGDTSGALARLRSVEASSSEPDMAFALRFAPRECLAAMRQHLGDQLPGDLRRLTDELMDAPHVLVVSAPRPQLTPAEQQVLALVTEGLTNKAIAERLFLSVNTVKSHMRSLFRKLGVSSRAEARAIGRSLLQ